MWNIIKKHVCITYVLYLIDLSILSIFYNYTYTYTYVCISVYQTSAGAISWLGQLTDLKGASTGKPAGFAVRATHWDREPPGSPRESKSPNNVAIHTPLIDGQSNFEDESHNRNHWKVQFTVCIYIYIYGDVCKMWGRHHLDLIQYLQE